MEDSSGFHPEAISKVALGLLKALATTEFLSRFYLAGGTALALHCGHRRSVDFDFFAMDAFQEDLLLATLREGFKPSVLGRAPQTLHLQLSEVKVSFIGYPYPLLFPTGRFSGVEVADIRDIACMKVSAVASRGTRRDFVDLYVAAQTCPLGEILALFVRKYAGIEYHRLHLLKSLTYFDDAEKDPPLDLTTEISWSEVRAFFIREVEALL
jgi:predicted nucleotidyltransferase component of viral defense system